MGLFKRKRKKNSLIMFKIPDEKTLLEYGFVKEYGDEFHYYVWFPPRKELSWSVDIILDQDENTFKLYLGDGCIHLDWDGVVESIAYFTKLSELVG